MRRAPGLLGRAALLAAGLASCAPATPRTRAEQAALSACRRQADAAYLRQNRALLSLRDTRDNPFSSSGDTGVISAGLGDRYGHDQMVEDCVRATLGGEGPDAAARAGVDNGTGPQMSPNSQQPTLPGQAP